MSFQQIPISQLQLNPMTKIAKEWMLITAGTIERGYNTMTASWGQMGSLWGTHGGSPVTTIYIRPQRYTKQFVDREGYYSLSFFASEYKQQLAYLGSHSGKEEDKVKKVGFTPISDANTTWFEEADLVLVCKKLYHAPILESGFETSELVDANYPERDFHEMYIGEIHAVYVKENK